MKFDIIIVGGGMVGGALAYALSKKPYQIALIDAADGKAKDARLIALNHGSCCFFKNIGIWPMLSQYATPISQIHVSHQGHFGISRIDAKELGFDSLGHVVPAHYINHTIFSSLKTVENVKLIRPATLKTLLQETDLVTVSVDSAEGEKTYSTDILIGADGSCSTVRELLKIDAKTVNYQQSALVTITELAREHKNIAYERFQDQGAIAMLPLNDAHVATIWTASAEYITYLMQLTDAEFLQQLQKQFGYRLGRLLKVGERATYPLMMQQAQQQKKQNAILIGNAAHTIHPVAAQGLNMALYEVAVLTDYLLMQTTLQNCLKNFPANSLQQNFNRYLSHGLTELFSKDFFPLAFARQLGMIGFDQCFPLKKKFANYAMGKAGRVPRLLLYDTE